MRAAWVITAVTVAAVLCLTILMPWAAPFSGDNGLRLWSASSGPGAPLDRAVPPGMDPAGFPPSLTRTGQHGLFPTYGTLLPAAVSLGGLLDCPLVWRLLVAAASLLAIPLLTALSGGAGPLCFLAAGLFPYALLFWEHGPAVTLFLLAAVLLRRSLRRTVAPFWWLAAAALACRLRPELAPAAAALLAVTLVHGKSLPGAGRTMIWALAALGCAGLGALIFPESVMGGQVLANMPAGPAELLSSRLEVLTAWTAGGPLLVRAALLLWAASSLALLTCRGGPRLRGGLLAAGLAGSAILLYPVARGAAGTMSLLTLAPAALLLPAASWRARGEGRTLLAAGILGGGLVALLAPTHGMFQFGPRFLLAPLALAAAGGWLGLRALEDRKWRRAATLGALLLGLLGAARGAAFCGYFRGSHSRLQRSVESVSCDAVCTDQEWLPLVCWPQSETLPILVTEPAAAERLASEGLALVWLSPATELAGRVGERGYRGMRYSLPEGSGAELPPPVPGDITPSPPALALR